MFQRGGLRSNGDGEQRQGLRWLSWSNSIPLALQIREKLEVEFVSQKETIPEVMDHDGQVIASYSNWVVDSNNLEFLLLQRNFRWVESIEGE